MHYSLRILLPASLIVALTGCIGPKPLAYKSEKFESTDTFARRFPAAASATCEAARRTLLSQGYVINTSSYNQVDARKSFQPQSDVHVQIGFRVVCASDGLDDRMASVFANAVEDRYALKKVNNSATVGVGALGSLSLPFSSSDDSLVKVASETISAEGFYDRFFALVERYLANEKKPVESAAKIPSVHADMP